MGCWKELREKKKKIPILKRKKEVGERERGRESTIQCIFAILAIFTGVQVFEFNQEDYE
jgi:hypothetical protein